MAVGAAAHQGGVDKLNTGSNYVQMIKKHQKHKVVIIIVLLVVN